MAVRLFELWFPLCVMFLLVTQIFLPMFFGEKLFYWFRPGGFIFEGIKSFFTKSL